MKKILSILSIVLVLVMALTVAYAAENDVLVAENANVIRVQLNGEVIDFTDDAGNVVNPQLINDRTMVPMRKIFEELGSTVNWVEETQSITAVKDGIEIGLQIENEKATVKNESGEVTEITLDSVPVIINDRTLVPVRFISESLNKKVDWDENNQAVIIIDADIVSKTIKEKAPTFYEYLEENDFVVNSYTANGEVSGKIKYTDAESRSNTSTLTIVGSYEEKVNESLMYAEGNLNITGKGSLYDAIKESKLDKVNATVIFDAEKGSIYVNGSMFDEEYKNQWIKYVFSDETAKEYEAQMASMNLSQGQNTIEMLDNMIQNAEGLTLDSYATLKEILDLVCGLLNDNHFSVVEKSNAKVYTLKFDLKDILLLAKLTDEELKNIENTASLTIEAEITSKEHVPTNTTSEIKFSYTEGDEAVEGTLKLTESIKDINEKVEITMPNSKDVVEQKI